MDGVEADSDPDRRRRNKVSIKAAAKANRDTAPTLNGAVIVVVNASASGCTPEMTMSKIRATATNAARSARKPKPAG